MTTIIQFPKNAQDIAKAKTIVSVAHRMGMKSITMAHAFHAIAEARKPMPPEQEAKFRELAKKVAQRMGVQLKPEHC